MRLIHFPSHYLKSLPVRDVYLWRKNWRRLKLNIFMINQCCSITISQANISFTVKLKTVTSFLMKLD